MSEKPTYEALEQRVRDLEQAEQALAESERKFRLVTETIQDVFWMSTPGVTQMLYVSPEYEKIWRKSAQQLYASPRVFLESIHPDDLESYISIMDAFHARGKVYQCEYRILPDPGSVRWIHERGYPINDDQGHTVRMIGLCTDITDRKLAEEQLRVKAAQLHARNKELNCLFRISETMRRSEARPLEEALREIVSFIPPAWQYPDNACARVIIDGHIFSTDNFNDTRWKLSGDIVVNNRMAGRLNVCYLDKMPDADEGPFLETEKKTLDFLAERIGRFIEHKRAKDVFQESERKYRSMMEAFVDPLYICSSDFFVEYINPAMIRRIGRDATGEKCHQALHGLDTQCGWCIFKKRSPHEPIEIDVKSPLDHRTYRVANMPIHNPDGTVSKMSVFRDITDYVQAIEDKEKAQAKLMQAQKMETIGNMAGAIAHDFNNILTSIIGFTELALDDVEKDSVIEESLQEVYTAGKRAKDLVEQILAVALGG